MTTVTEGSEKMVLEKTAASIISKTLQAIRQHGWCSLVLAGGNSPRKLYRKLAEGLPYELVEPDCRDARTGNDTTVKLPWEKIMLFWGDERCVPLNHPDSNFRMVQESLLDYTEIPENNIFSMPHVTTGFADAAMRYETTLKHFFQSHHSSRPSDNLWPAFDIILLGMGNDGHTASLFPDDTPALEEKHRWVTDVHAQNGSPPGHRLTLTLPLINNAASVLFYVNGEKKTALAHQIISGVQNTVPAARINPKHGDLQWFLADGSTGQKPVSGPQE